MNTQVNSEAPAGHAEAPVQVAVAETAPVPLTPVAAAITETPAATPRKSVLDDFLDADDAEAAAADQAIASDLSDVVVEDDGDALAEDEGTLEGLDDEPSEADGESDSASEEGTLDGLEGATNPDADLEELEDLEEVAEEEESMVVIDVFKQKCTDCTHLVPWGSKTHKRCHFSNGNELCPAQSVRIRRYIPVDQIVARFMAAETQGDTDMLLNLYAKLKEKAPDVQEEIHAALKTAREKKALKAA